MDYIARLELEAEFNASMDYIAELRAEHVDHALDDEAEAQERYEAALAAGATHEEAEAAYWGDL